MKTTRAKRVQPHVLQAGRVDWSALLRLLPDYDPYDQAEGYWFDEEAAFTAIEFIETYIRHAKGTKAVAAGELFGLQPWQQCIVANLFGWKGADGLRRYRECLIYVPKKNGKALALDTPIPTPFGWTTMGALKEGDDVFDENGTPCRVTFATPVQYGRTCYRVSFDDGTSIIADAEHQWFTESRVVDGRFKDVPVGGVRNTEEIARTLRYSAGHNHAVPVTAPLELLEADLLIPPYVLGVWLGDGDSNGARFTGHADDWEVPLNVAKCGVAVGDGVPDRRRAKTLSYGLGNGIRGSTRAVSFKQQLRTLGVLGKKWIPPQYLRASVLQRTELLRGLMDTDGTCSKAGQCEFCTTSPKLKRGFLELARSLGYKPTVKEVQPVLSGAEFCKKSYRIQFWAFSDRPVFLLSRKAKRLKSPPLKRSRSAYRKITAVDLVPSVPVKCIQVDSSSHLYLAGRGMVPTHNTAFAAALILCVMMTDGEIGAEFYSAASSRDQAALLFGHVMGMVKADPELSARLTIYGAKGGSQQKSVVYEDMGIAYKCLSADADTVDGVNPHMSVIDELHRHPDGELTSVLQLSTAARAQPLTIYTTTADYNRPSVCNEMLRRAKKVQKNKGVRSDVGYDPTFLPVIYEADKKDDYQDPEVWAGANPNFGVTITHEFMATEAKKAYENPSLLNNFLRLHLNIITDAIEVWLSMHKWNPCHGLAEGETPPQWRNRMLRELKGRRVFVGMDLSSTIDVTCICLIFRPKSDDGIWIFIPFFWVPAETARDKEHTDQVPYSMWAREGFLRFTPGSEVETPELRKFLNDLKDDFDVEAIGYDPWNATELARQLREEDGWGDKMVKVRQGSFTLSEPMKKFMAFTYAKRVAHGANPVMKWMLANVVVQPDDNGNIKPSKKKSTGKIDGPVATFTGMAVALEAKPEEEGDGVLDSVRWL